MLLLFLRLVEYSTNVTKSGQEPRNKAIAFYALLLE